MSFRASTNRRPFGMAAVAAFGSLALVITAGIVLSGTPDERTGSAALGVIETYSSEPTEAWTLDETSLPGAGGNGSISVTATGGTDWLVAYSAGIKRSFMLIDSRSGRPQWDAPINAGFGDCSINDQRQIGCAVRLRISGPENGFYLADRDSGDLTRTADGGETATVLGLGPNFVHVNQSGYQVSMRSAAGKTLWSRTFAGAAKVRSARSALIIETSDGASFVVDPRTGSDRVACAQCTVDEFATGLTVTTTKSGSESVEFYPFTTSSVAEEPSGRADRARVVRGPSTYPVIAPAGEGSSLAGAGRYEIIDPGTGEALWNIADPELSKANARPCGTVISVARKDRSRVFFTLSDGTRRGSMPPPALDQPDANLDAATCLGASDDVAVFANPNQLTAYDINTGQLRWTRTLLGTAEDVDGQIVLRQGSTLSKLGAN